MSDNETIPEKPFFADRAKTGRAGCKKCKQKIEANSLRLAKIGANPFGDGTMKMWHHVICLFEVFKKQRATTARIKSPDDIGGWEDLEEDDQEEILKFLPDCSMSTNVIKNATKSPDKIQTDIKCKKISKTNKAHNTIPNSNKECTSTSKIETSISPNTDKDVNHKDNSFREFRRLCADLSNEPSYSEKTALVKHLFTNGSDGKGFKGDKLLWCRLLLPGVIKRVYNLQSKQLVKHFSRILQTDLDGMLEDLEQGDVAETVRIFFEQSLFLKPTKKSILTLFDVDLFLAELAKMTKEDDQILHLTSIAKRCTSNDLKILVRLIKHDLRINAGAKPILSAIHPDAYQAFQASRDISAILSRADASNPSNRTNNLTADKNAMNITVTLMTPIQPMLAEPCKAVSDALKKCPNGIYSEIKYDGERVQVHKQGNEFKYFSRSLKPVMQHKIAHFKQYIPQAFPHGEDLILDAEILMIDTNTGNPLPFGTLGKHKKMAIQHANVCLFVFDCIFYNGDILLKTPMKERRQILEKNMVPIKNHVMVSEMEELHTSEELETMITKVFKLGLEGLVLKDLFSIYEPGKRHWLKVKKDYLFEGSMADSVDLVVLGAWFGTGSKGGMMSSFLMGVVDTVHNKWCTVTKVHGGHDDVTLERLQTELKMVKISKDVTQAPSWLNATKSMVPDFVAIDPCKMPIWEITGAEFTQHEVHTANGISIRFPRVTKIRSDKDWKSATSLNELDQLYKKSKENSDFSLKGKRTPVKCPPSEESKLKLPIIDDLIVNNDSNIGTSEKKQPKLQNVYKASSSATTSNANLLPSKRQKLNDSSVFTIPFPDIFVGVKLYLPLSALSKYERHFVAYGGIILELENGMESTHVIHFAGTCEKYDWPKSARHVEVAWLESSIKNLKVQDVSDYAVYC